MKVIIAGSRTFDNYHLLQSECDKILQGEDQVEIVSGGARGADKMGEVYAKSKGYSLKIFPADWNQFGKSAGYIRNKQMAEYSDCLIAFWDGISRGTSNMIQLAKENNLSVHVIKY